MAYKAIAAQLLIMLLQPTAEINKKKKNHTHNHRKRLYIHNYPPNKELGYRPPPTAEEERTYQEPPEHCWPSYNRVLNDYLHRSKTLTTSAQYLTPLLTKLVTYSTESYITECRIIINKTQTVSYIPRTLELHDT